MAELQGSVYIPEPVPADVETPQFATPDVEWNKEQLLTTIHHYQALQGIFKRNSTLGALLLYLTPTYAFSRLETLFYALYSQNQYFQMVHFYAMLVKEGGEGSLIGMLKSQNNLGLLERVVLYREGRQTVERISNPLYERMESREDIDYEIDMDKITLDPFRSYSEIVLNDHESLLSHACLENQKALLQGVHTLLEQAIETLETQSFSSEFYMLLGTLHRAIGGEDAVKYIRSVLMTRWLVPSLLARLENSTNIRINRNTLLLCKLLQSLSYCKKRINVEGNSLQVEGLEDVFQRFLETIAGLLEKVPEAEESKSVESSQQVDVDGMFILHGILFDCRKRILEVIAMLLGEEGAEAGSQSAIPAKIKQSIFEKVEVEREQLLKLKEIVSSLGMAPTVLKRMNRGEDVSIRRDSNEKLRSVSADPSLEGITKVGFFYRGACDAEGNAVYYLIASKLRMEYLANINTIISYMYSVLQEDDGWFSIVIDMSWSQLGREMQIYIYRHLKQITALFSHDRRKRVGKVYVVHPNAYTATLVRFIRTFASGKLKRKVVEIYDWKELHHYLGRGNVSIPQSSKELITEAYAVRKVNAKGKSQNRLVKFTQRSILNIDPSGRTIQNERLLVDIERVGVSKETTEIQITFSAKANVRKGLVAHKKSKGRDALFRRYISRCREEQMEIIKGIFIAAARTPLLEGCPQEFAAREVDRNGKQTAVVVKLATDSLLMVQGRKIKGEIGYSSISDVKAMTKEELAIFFRTIGGVKVMYVEEMDAEKVAASIKNAMEIHSSAVVGGGVDLDIIGTEFTPAPYVT